MKRKGHKAIEKNWSNGWRECFPLQFQKQIRLQEARRLMLGEDLDAESAGFRVGYEDPSYFSRDYKKHFGAPPQRDIAKLRSNLEYLDRVRERFAGYAFQHELAILQIMR